MHLQMTGISGGLRHLKTCCLVPVFKQPVEEIKVCAKELHTGMDSHGIHT